MAEDSHPDDQQAVPVAAPDTVEQSDTVEIPLDAEPEPESTSAVAEAEEADSKDLPPAPSTPKADDTTQESTAPTERVDDSADAQRPADVEENDNAPPPPPPKTQPETPAKPTLPRGTSAASMQDVELSRGPTPGPVPERTPSASTAAGVEAGLRDGEAVS